MFQTYHVKIESTTILIDGAHAVRRSMYTPAYRELSNSIGIPTGAFYGFLKSLNYLASSVTVDNIIVIWEGGHSKRRKSLCPDYKYKEHEEELDSFGMTDYEYYQHQTKWVKQFLKSAGIPQLQVFGKEGDDVLYRACKLLKGNKIIVSADKDFGLILDAETSLLRPTQKQYINLNNFKDETGYESPKYYLYAKAILGDRSDNISQAAKGVGEKTIQDILEHIDESELSTNAILREAAMIDNHRTKKLVEAGPEIINRNLDLMDISREPFSLEDLLNMISTLEQEYESNHTELGKIFEHMDISEDDVAATYRSLDKLKPQMLSSIINRDYIKQALV